MIIDQTAVSCLALILCIIVVVLSRKTSGPSNLLTMTQIEMQIRDQIYSAFREIERLTVAPGVDENFRKTLLSSAIERYLNMYEYACQKYLDGKLDRELFKKSYSREIRSLVEGKEFSDKYGAGTPHNATLSVYQQWFNRDK